MMPKWLDLRVDQMMARILRLGNAFLQTRNGGIPCVGTNKRAAAYMSLLNDGDVTAMSFICSARERRRE